MVKQMLDCGFTVFMRDDWIYLPREERRLTVKGFDTPYSDPEAWGANFIAGMVTSDSPTTRSELKEYLETVAKKVPYSPLVEKIHVGGCKVI